MYYMWFVHHNNYILGPFPKEAILRDIETGQIDKNAYIWSKGQSQWVPISHWQSNPENQLSFSDASKKKWRLRAGQKVLENLSFEEATAALKKLNNYEWVSVSLQEKEDWTPFYSSYVFMEALNISRRRYLRTPLMGLAKVTKENSDSSYVVKTATIGQGGIGVYGLGHYFTPGTRISLKIESNDLNAIINTNGTIVYNTDQGFVGVCFDALSEENKQTIIEYTRNFQTDYPTQKEEKNS